MAASAILAIKIVADASQAGKGFDQASTKAGKFGSAMKKAAVPAAAVAVAAIAAGKKVVKAASDQEQAYGGLDAVYGKHADTVKASAKTAASSAGLSATAYAEMAAQIGGQLKSAGVPIDKVAGQTDKLIKRGADLATTYGGTTADAVNALSASFRGEFDSSEKLNVGLSASAVQAELVRKGQDKLTGAALAAAKVQATQELIYKNSGDAAGQFAKQTDSLAEKQQIAQANMENTAATLGAVLLPVVGFVTDALADLAGWMGKNAKIVQIVAGVIGGLAAVILVITGIMRVYAIVQGIVNAVMAANPAVLIALAIIALIVVIVLLIKNWSKVKAVALAVWRAITGAVTTAGAKIKALWDRVFGAISAKAKAVLIAIKTFFTNLASSIKAGVSAYIAFYRAKFQSLVDKARAIITSIKTFFTSLASSIKAGVSAYIAFYRAKFQSLVDKARAIIAAVKTFFAGLASAIKAGVTNYIAFYRTKLQGIWDKAKEIADKVKAAFQSIRDKVKGLSLPNPFSAMKGWIDGVIGKIQDLIDWLSKIHVPSIHLPGKGKSAPAVATAPGVSTAAPMTARGGLPGRSATSAGAGPTFVINAPFGDGDQVARSLDLILARRGRRTSGVRRIGTRVGTA